MNTNITLVGIAYLIFKREPYGFIGWPYVQTHVPGVMTFLEASGSQHELLDEGTFQDMFNWLER